MTNAAHFARSIPIDAIVTMNGNTYRVASEIEHKEGAGFCFYAYRMAKTSGKFSSQANRVSGHDLEPVRG